MRRHKAFVYIYKHRKLTHVWLRTCEPGVAIRKLSFHCWRATMSWRQWFTTCFWHLHYKWPRCRFGFGTVLMCLDVLLRPKKIVEQKLNFHQTSWKNCWIPNKIPTNSTKHVVPAAVGWSKPSGQVRVTSVEGGTTQACAFDRKDDQTVGVFCWFCVDHGNMGSWNMLLLLLLWLFWWVQVDIFTVFQDLWTAGIKTMKLVRCWENLGCECLEGFAICCSAQLTTFTLSRPSFGAKCCCLSPRWTYDVTFHLWPFKQYFQIFKIKKTIGKKQAASICGVFVWPYSKAACWTWATATWIPPSVVSHRRRRGTLFLDPTEG